MKTVFYTYKYLNKLSLNALRKMAENYGLKEYLRWDKKKIISAIYKYLKQEREKELAKPAYDEMEVLPPIKTEEEREREYIEQFIVERDPETGAVKLDPFTKGPHLTEEEKTAKFSDRPLRLNQTTEEIYKEIVARRDILIPVKMEDGRTIYLGETPTQEQINELYMRRVMKEKAELEKLALENEMQDPGEKPKRKTTRKKKETGEMTEQEKAELEKSLEVTEEEYNDLFNVSDETPINQTENSDVAEREKECDTQKESSHNKSYDKTEEYGKYKKKAFNGSRSDRNRSENVDPDEDDSAPIEYKEGILEIMPDGYGFLRAHNYESGENDAYVSAQRIRRSGLRKGDYVKAEAKKICDNRPAGVINVLEVNGCAPETAFNRKNFDSLTPIYPDTRFRLELPGKSTDFAIRCIDLVAPIGKGQRSMIVSPPKAGKTTLLKAIARSISSNYPDAHLMVLLVDERPEEVTDMQRSIDGEVIYSTFDEMPEHHTKAAELVLERAKRLVEMDKDVVILMDSLTRLARAYNLTISPTGRTLSGGIDPGALHSPKRFFGAARNIEFGGSLTIIATALVDTGSRMDDVIYEEFKGTGNMEIHLDRRLSERRIFPAIDLYRSGTRRDEMLLDQDEIGGIWGVRKMLSTGGDTSDATETLINMMVKTKTNKEFIEQLNVQLKKMKDNGYLN